MSNKNVLFWDLETSPLQAWVWQCGEQYIRHQQLVKGHSRWGIICLSYAWNDGKAPKTLTWNNDTQNCADLIEKFDKIAASADVVIGKNSDRFDCKMMNTLRMLYNLPVNVDWIKYTDDLEKQMRKFFRLPSQSLDYISNELGLGGKVKMEMQDWIDIMEQNDNGAKALKKMQFYNRKDVTDTRSIWNYAEEHFTPKFISLNGGCKHCGESVFLTSDGYRQQGKSRYHQYFCTKCSAYAGRARMLANGKEGKIS